MLREPVAGVRAVLFTDMVGSTALRSRLGDDRADQLHRDHDALLVAVVEQFGGRVLRSTGDGFKTCFDSASAAVSAALAMQRAVARYGRSATGVAPFQIRIGVSVGEVTEEAGDIRGIAVIEGARLEAIAPPGEVLATDLVQRLAQRRVNATFHDAGEHLLKGLEDPVAVRRVVDTSTDARARPLPRALSADRRFPLVGRDGAVAALLARWGEVQWQERGLVVDAAVAVPGRPASTVLVTGQPGMGKSRLVAEAAQRIHDDGALVLAGVCDADLAVPYQPFAQAFVEVTDLDEELGAAVDHRAGQLAALFPGGRVGPFEDAGPAARFELFESVVALLRRLSQDQPVVVVLEDLHWATAPTVGLLRHLVRRVGDDRVLLVVTYRADEVAPGHPLHDLLVETREVPQVGRLALEALGLRDVVELVDERARRADAARVDVFARRVLQESSGSPFFVCELLHHLDGTAGLDRLLERGATTELPVPDSVRDVVGQRLARLPAGVPELLTVAATVGLTFDLELVATIADRPIEDVLEVLEDAERVSLVQEVDVNRFAFGHAIVRATLLDGLRATRRALAHRRVAEAIERLGRADHVDLAYHWQRAGVERNAMASLELAARSDLAALAYESALERYETVLAFHRAEATPDPAVLARVWLGVGLARRALGQNGFAPAIEEAGRIGRQVGDTTVVVEAALASIWPGTYFVTPGLTQTGSVELAEAALVLVGEDDPRRPRLLSTLAAHLTFDGDRSRCSAVIAEALTVARRLGGAELVGTVLVAEFLVLWDPTTAAHRREIVAEVTELAQRSGNNDLQFFAGFFAAICATETGDLAAALGHLDDVAGPVAASQNFYLGFLADRLRASIGGYTCRPDAQARIDEVATRYDRTYADSSGSWSIQTAGIARQQGRLGDLVGVMRTLLETSDLGPTWWPALAMALLHAGDPDGAAEVLDRFEEPPLDFFWLTITQITAELAVELGRRELQVQTYQSLLPFHDQLGITAAGSLVLELVATTLGDLTLAMGDAAAAVEHLEGAIALADRMGAPFEAVRARRLLATALIELGSRPADAAAALTIAADLATTHGFAREARLVAALRDRSGDLASLD